MRLTGEDTLVMYLVRTVNKLLNDVVQEMYSFVFLRKCFHTEFRGVEILLVLLSNKTASDEKVENILFLHNKILVVTTD